jgi:outer membrane lipoprotein-sorting protein
MKIVIIKVILILTLMVCICCASENKKARKRTKCASSMKAAEGKTSEVDAVLKNLNKKTSGLKTFQAQVEYRFIQPLLESQKLQKGDLYYAKLGDNSKLRLNFKTSRIDDEEEEKYLEEYILLDGTFLTHSGRQFDGMWAVQIDYEMEAVKYIQLTQASDPNKPTDVFELIGREFPMIGFSRIEDIKKQFDVTLVKQKKSGPEDFIQLHLKVKPDSVYKDNYFSIDFWIDKKSGLPAKILTISTEPATEPVELKEVSEIKFINSKFNNNIEQKIFDFKIPAGFDEPEIMPLKKKDGQK